MTTSELRSSGSITGLNLNLITQLLKYLIECEVARLLGRQFRHHMREFRLFLIVMQTGLSLICLLVGVLKPFYLPVDKN